MAAAAEEVSEIDSRIDALKRNLDTLLQRFTEQHPDVVGTRRVIAELEEQKSQGSGGTGMCRRREACDIQHGESRLSGAEGFACNCGSDRRFASCPGRRV